MTFGVYVPLVLFLVTLPFEEIFGGKLKQYWIDAHLLCNTVYYDSTAYHGINISTCVLYECVYIFSLLKETKNRISQINITTFSI